MRKHYICTFNEKNTIQLSTDRTPCVKTESMTYFEVYLYNDNGSLYKNMIFSIINLNIKNLNMIALRLLSSVRIYKGRRSMIVYKTALHQSLNDAQDLM